MQRKNTPANKCHKSKSHYFIIENPATFNGSEHQLEISLAFDCFKYWMHHACSAAA